MKNILAVAMAAIWLLSNVAIAGEVLWERPSSRDAALQNANLEETPNAPKAARILVYEACRRYLASDNVFPRLDTQEEFLRHAIIFSIVGGVRYKTGEAGCMGYSAQPDLGALNGSNARKSLLKACHKFFDVCLVFFEGSYEKSGSNWCGLAEWAKPLMEEARQRQKMEEARAAAAEAERAALARQERARRRGPSFGNLLVNLIGGAAIGYTTKRAIDGKLSAAETASVIDFWGRAMTGDINEKNVGARALYSGLDALTGGRMREMAPLSQGDSSSNWGADASSSNSSAFSPSGPTSSGMGNTASPSACRMDEFNQYMSRLNALADRIASGAVRAEGQCGPARDAIGVVGQMRSFLERCPEFDRSGKDRATLDSGLQQYQKIVDSSTCARRQ